MSEWKEYKLGELGKIVTGKTPPTSQHQNYDGDIPFICIPDLGKSRFIFHTNKTISKIGLETVKNCSLPKGSVVVSCIATIGQVGITTKDISVTNQQINSLIPDSNLITEEFCYYYFKNLGEDLAQFGGGGSIFEIISKDKFSKVYLTIPSLPEQTAIASVLSSLDDKIDLLHRQNATLEKMGETLFRQWFVEDAKEEWECYKLKDLVKHVKPGTNFQPKRIEYGIPFLNVRNLNNGFIDLSDTTKISKEEYQRVHKNWEPEENDILISRIGTLGIVAVIQGSDLPVAVHYNMINLKAKTISYQFLYFLLKSQLFKEKYFSNVRQSVQEYVTIEDTENVEISLPIGTDLFKEHEIAFNELFNKIKSNQTQIRTLTALRDTLLPKLMSGEIRVL